MSVALDILLSSPVVDAAGACEYLSALVALRCDYHPEDSASEIVVGATGEALFTPAQAVLADARMAEVASFLADPCEYLLAVYADAAAP